MRPSLRLSALAAALTCLPHAGRAAERPWRLIRGAHVTVVGQQPPNALRRIAVEIEQFRFTVGAAIHGAAQPPAMPTLVYTFDDRRALEPFVPLYRGRPAVLGGYCLCGGTTDANLIVADLSGYDDASAIIFHEYTHLLTRSAAGTLPTWLNEGLAEYFSTFRMTDHEQRAEIGRPIVSHVQALRTQMLTVEELLQVTPESPLYNEGDRRSVFYAEAWALTHFLLTERSTGPGGVNGYVNALGHGVPDDVAFTAAFGATPAEMTAQLKQYVRRPVLKSTIYVLNERVDVDEPERAETLSAAEANARLGRIQVRVNRADEAAPRIEAAAQAAVDNPETQLALALLRLHQNRAEDARGPLEKAVALAPNDFVTQYVYGLLLLRDAIDAPEGSGDKRELAHAALTRAVAANPQSADALAWQAYADLSAGVRLEEARDAMRRAVELAPGQQDFRVRLAQIEARIAARPKPKPRDDQS